MKKNSRETHLLQCKKENRNRGATVLLDYLTGHAIHEDDVRKRFKELFNRIALNENAHSFDLLGAQDKLSAAHSAKTLIYLTNAAINRRLDLDMSAETNVDIPTLPSCNQQVKNSLHIKCSIIRPFESHCVPVHLNGHLFGDYDAVCGIRWHFDDRLSKFQRYSISCRQRQ
jgi:hypothetical protein